MGTYLREKGDQTLREKGVNYHLCGRNIITICFGSSSYELSDPTLPPAKHPRDLVAGVFVSEDPCLHLLQRGIATMEGPPFVLSAQIKENIDQTIEVFGLALNNMVAENIG